MTLSPDLRQYLENDHQDYLYHHQPYIESFAIDDLALSVGKFYEKIRKVIDWKDENALRRGTIVRALKRNLVAQFYGFGPKDYTQEQNQKLAQTLVLDLMRSGYFENKLIHDKQVDLVAQILFKYAAILQELNHQRQGASRKDARDKIKFQTWILQIAAGELESTLAPNYSTLALATLMQDTLRQRIKLIPQTYLTPEEKDQFLLLTTWRALFEADDYLLAYHFLLLTRPTLFQNKTLNDSNSFEAFFQAKNFFQEVPALRQFQRLAHRYAAAFRILGDIQTEIAPTAVSTAEKAWVDRPKIQELYATIYDRRYSSLKKRLLRTAFWTTLSILVANAFSVFVIEGPVAALLGLDFTWVSILLDIFIPSFFMFILVIIIRPPVPENKPVVLEEIEKIAYPQKEIDIYELKQKRRASGKAVKVFFYASTFIAGALGLFALYQLFYFAGLPWTSIYLNIVYLTMVLFASLNIRHQAIEITIYEKSTIFDFILDIFSIPLARIGQWFSKKWKEYNIFSVIFSVLIDAPLSFFIGFIEDWREYLKEKKSEIR